MTENLIEDDIIHDGLLATSYLPTVIMFIVHCDDQILTINVSDDQYYLPITTNVPILPSIKVGECDSFYVIDVERFVREYLEQTFEQNTNFSYTFGRSPASDKLLMIDITLDHAYQINDSPENTQLKFQPLNSIDEIFQLSMKYYFT